jgi:hypothetical protein
MKPLVYILAVVLGAAALFWASASFGVIAFAAPQNPAWKTWLFILAYCGIPLAVAAVAITKSLSALWRGRPQRALIFVLLPVAVAALALVTVYGALGE